MTIIVFCRREGQRLTLLAHSILVLYGMNTIVQIVETHIVVLSDIKNLNNKLHPFPSKLSFIQLTTPPPPYGHLPQIRRRNFSMRIQSLNRRIWERLGRGQTFSRLNCVSYSWAYNPLEAINSSCVPLSTIFPRSITRIRSAASIVLKR